MSNVKIYSVVSDELSPPIHGEGLCTDLVRHADFAALEQQLAESQSKLTQMAAENAGLKTFGDKLSEMHNDLNGEGTGIQGRSEVACQQVALEAAMEEFDAIKTPATDAFLAEVRASAVDSLIDIKTNQLARMHPDTHAFGATSDFIRSQINELQSFAALLRKGVQS